MNRVTWYVLIFPVFMGFGGYFFGYYVGKHTYDIKINNDKIGQLRVFDRNEWYTFCASVNFPNEDETQSILSDVTIKKGVIK